MQKTADFRTVLRRTFQSRKNRNPSYSLRAFARDLCISPARLCEVLSGQHTLSPATARKVAPRLGVSPVEADFFVDMVDVESRGPSATRAEARSRLKQREASARFQQLTDDTFQLISDWHHFALLEAVDLAGFDGTESWLARALDLAPFEVRDAVRRLSRLKLLRSRGGQLKKVAKDVSAGHHVVSEAVRNHHRQVIEKALAAVDGQGVEQRDLESLILAVDRRHLPEAFRKLGAFCREFNSDFGGDPDKNAVYCLAIQFFELTVKERH